MLSNISIPVFKQQLNSHPFHIDRKEPEKKPPDKLESNKQGLTIISVPKKGFRISLPSSGHSASYQKKGRTLVSKHTTKFYVILR